MGARRTVCVCVFWLSSNYEPSLLCYHFLLLFLTFSCYFHLSFIFLVMDWTSWGVANLIVKEHLQKTTVGWHDAIHCAKVEMCQRLYCYRLYLLGYLRKGLLYVIYTLRAAKKRGGMWKYKAGREPNKPRRGVTCFFKGVVKLNLVVHGRQATSKLVHVCAFRIFTVWLIQILKSELSFL